MTRWVELSHERPAHLFPTMLYWLGGVRAMQLVGVKRPIVANWYHDHAHHYVIREGEFLRAGRKILGRLKTDPNFLAQIIRTNRREIPRMLRAARRFTDQSLAPLTDRQLFGRWQRWLDRFTDLMTYSVMGTVLEMEQPLLSDAIEAVLAKKLGHDHPTLAEAFQLLTTPTATTVADREDRSLLKLRLSQLADRLDPVDLVGHVVAYGWIGFGYDGPSWSVQDVQQRLAGLPKELAAIQSLLQMSLTKARRFRSAQRRLSRSLKLSARDQHLFHCLRVLGYWKYQRKLMNQQAHALLDSFFREVARRRSLTLTQAKMIAPSEMKAVVVDGRVDPKLLAERIKASVVVFRGSDYQVLSGRAATQLITEIQASVPANDQSNQWAGRTAYPGQARGVVRLVEEASDVLHVNPGDILVSTATNPKLLPAMKIAGAIVTEAGGITSHAAIIARELKVPTVIGVRFATKMLVDGDLVEVDATKGIVRKVER